MSVVLRETPYHREKADSVARKAERGKMPKSLSGLLRWYVVSLAEELPERLHTSEPWHDRVTTHELEQGIHAVGGSHLGSPAMGHTFRLIIESSASVTDEDGYYLFPIRSALSRLARRFPLMARNLFALGMAEGDWQHHADAKGWTHEEYQVYIEEAMRRLWLETYDRTSRAA